MRVISPVELADQDRKQYKACDKRARRKEKFRRSQVELAVRGSRWTWYAIVRETRPSHGEQNRPDRQQDHAGHDGCRFGVDVRQPIGEREKARKIIGERTCRQCLPKRSYGDADGHQYREDNVGSGQNSPSAEPRRECFDAIEPNPSAPAVLDGSWTCALL